MASGLTSGRVTIDMPSHTRALLLCRLITLSLRYYAFAFGGGRAIEDWSAGATVGGAVIPDLPDLARMRRERFGRLQAELSAAGLDGLVLLGSSSVVYSTGAAMPALDGDRAALFRAVAVVVAGESAPHLYTLFDDGAPADVCVHGPLFPDLDDGMDQFAKALSEHFSPGARVGIDHFSHAMLRGLSGYEW